MRQVQLIWAAIVCGTLQAVAIANSFHNGAAVNVHPLPDTLDILDLTRLSKINKLFSFVSERTLIEGNITV